MLDDTVGAMTTAIKDELEDYYGKGNLRRHYMTPCSTLNSVVSLASRRNLRKQRSKQESGYS